ncbi:MULTISPECIES: hypothetical protein [Priestia]|uniref:hypothetical protein n=1 Tax=Priestia TaxID=2800373 RepID=UPI002FE2C1B6
MASWTDYLDFTGSILSGGIGGLMTYLGVKFTLDRAKKDKDEEDIRSSVKDTLKLIRILEDNSREIEDVNNNYQKFFNKFPSKEQYESGFTNNLLHEHIKELVGAFKTKSKECRNGFDNLYYDALETASLIDREAMLAVTNTFGEIREGLYDNEALTKPMTTIQQHYEFYQADYNSLELMHGLLRKLQNQFIEKLDTELHYYYKEYKDNVGKNRNAV